MTRILVLHPGAMGAAIGQTLRQRGHDVGWFPEGRGAATAARAEQAGLEAWQGHAEADVVISIVPPAAAIATAQQIAESGLAGLYLDANAISPKRAATVAGIVREAGATYVDGGVVGPPPSSAGTTRLFLSGSEAATASALFEGTRLEPVIVPGDDFGASAVKMTYAAWTKISAALVLAADQTAAEYGVSEALHAEWERSQPHLASQLKRAEADATFKGWRWVDEMQQIAETFDAVGKPRAFGEAAAEVFADHPRPE